MNNIKLTVTRAPQHSIVSYTTFQRHLFFFQSRQSEATQNKQQMPYKGASNITIKLQFCNFQRHLFFLSSRQSEATQTKQQMPSKRASNITIKFQFCNKNTKLSVSLPPLAIPGTPKSLHSTHPSKPSYQEFSHWASGHSTSVLWNSGFTGHLPGRRCHTSGRGAGLQTSPTRRVCKPQGAAHPGSWEGWLS